MLRCSRHDPNICTVPYIRRKLPTPTFFQKIKGVWTQYLGPIRGTGSQNIYHWKLTRPGSTRPTRLHSRQRRNCYQAGRHLPVTPCPGLNADRTRKIAHLPGFFLKEIHLHTSKAIARRSGLWFNTHLGVCYNLPWRHGKMWTPSQSSMCSLLQVTSIFLEGACIHVCTPAFAAATQGTDSEITRLW